MSRRRLILLLSILVTGLLVWRAARWYRARRFVPIRLDSVPSAAAARAQAFPRALFIGNSFTNDWGSQPVIVGTLARTTPGPAPIFEQVAADGETLRHHWDRQIALGRIREGAWDYVVIQGHSQEPLLDPKGFTAYANRFASEIRRVNAQPVLFMTWAKAAEAPNVARIAAAYEVLGRDLNCDVVPVGLAFAAAMDGPDRPAHLKLYVEDGRHASAAGAYLTGCCFYSFFYDVPAAVLPRGQRPWMPVDDATAVYLQKVAYDVVRAWRARHPLADHPGG